ncbi:RNA dependent RNA polymerase-domain-containing protein [Aspergillus stella-maris]|uniref:RNA dependent RNA polymerase-domain-containing protein n=1 Tax=Aspergillus stella-maris TaxID=1810926 RepID=UPI003CCD314D
MQKPRSRSGPAPQAPRQQVIPDWKSFESVAVFITDIPQEATTQDLWKAFNQEGPIFSIDIWENSHGKRISKGKIRFRRIALHDGRTVTLQLSLDIKPLDRIPSPLRFGHSSPMEVRIPITSLDIGILIDETTMVPMRTVGSTTSGNAYVALNLKYKELLVYFDIPTPSAGNQVPPQKYRLKVPFSQLEKFYQVKNPSTRSISHFTILSSPPMYHRRITNLDRTFIEETSWKESDAWFRQTNIVHNPDKLADLPISLRRQNPIIDIGRWNAFRINYPKNCDHGGKFKSYCDDLRDYNLVVEETDRFTVHCDVKKQPTTVWDWIDLEPEDSGSSFSSLQDLIDSNHIHLPFAVRYQLEVCISQGVLSEFTMTQEFVLKLVELGEKQARKLLEHISLQKKIYYRPMEIFDIKFFKGITAGKVPSYCCQMRSARISPSTIYYSVPSVDISNRVIRHFIEFSDNFLRIRFTDEKYRGRIYSAADNTMDEVFTRIKRTLANGITLGSTHYEFLAFGNSQFREHGAYFFAPKDGVTAASIRAWMGQFSHIRNIAKHAARLGQCFSTTRAVSGCTAHVVRIDDVERNGYTFSDGVGKISNFLAQMAMSELKIKTPNGEPPSAYQFRLGGCKGMLIVSPDARRQEVHIRDSQFKFAALHKGLEIIRWSQYSLASLNRQLILVLSTLGVSDTVFHQKLKSMLRNLDGAMESDPKAVCLLRKYVDPNQATLTISQMVLDGFRRSNEPFVVSLLTLWRAWHLKSLKEKAKIALEKAACLLGCMDETSTLKGYFSDNIPKAHASREEKIAALPEIFVQVHRPEDGGRYEVIEGVCILARNPSLHPGDIRVVRAVNVPALQYLKDLVVLPQTGDRDVASMCSGGDLDGDDYIVVWDQDLLPDDWSREPMSYTGKKAQDLDRDVTVDNITSFFVMYMKNDCLPSIAHAHLAWGDYLEDGVNEAKCMELAQLHSDAVDYNKSGTPAVMKRSLKPNNWPHFMERKNSSYRSGKILGQLYDAVERVDFVPSLEMNFDKRILNAQLEVSSELYKYARELKGEYDTSIGRIMAQHEIKTEFEVWSTFVLGHSNMSRDYKFHEDMGDISSALLEDFKKRAYEKVGGRTFDMIAPLVLAMYRVTHEEMAAALDKHRKENPPDKKMFNVMPPPKYEELPLISFPWIFPKILGQIAVSHYEDPDNKTTLSTGQFTGVSGNDSGSANLEPSTQDIKAAGEEQQDNDPFGLNLHEEPRSRIVIPDNIRLPNDPSIDSLESLLDFGLSGTPSTPSASLVLPSGSVHEELLDFDRDPTEGGWTANPQKAIQVFNESEPAKEASTKLNGHCDHTLEPLKVKPAANIQETPSVKEIKEPVKKNGIVEMVEEESDGGDDPLGIDELGRLAGVLSLSKRWLQQ